jgi:membrane fusion protein
MEGSSRKKAVSGATRRMSRLTTRVGAIFRKDRISQAKRHVSQLTTGVSTLFRKEAVAHATQRLSGAVVLATPLSTRVLALFFGAILVAAVIFISMATYARKVTVTGWLVPDRGMIRATSSSAGFIQNIVVKEGEAVARAATIAEVQISAQTGTGNVAELLLQQLKAELEAVRAKGQSQLDRLEDESKQASKRLANLRSQLNHLQRQTELQEDQLRIARQQLERGEKLAAQRHMTRNELEKRRSAVLSAEQELANLQRQIAAMERDMSEASARISAIRIEQESVRADLRTSEANFRQRMIDAEARRVLMVLSPVAGRVAAMPVAVGQPVTAGATIAVIIPEGTTLEAELLVPSRGAGFIRSGQEVRLMLQAFPHQRFGTVGGTVKTISLTVLGPTEISIPGVNIQEPVFRVRVGLAREKIQAYGELISLQPGMVLSADIIVDRRSLIQWLFDPIFAVAQRS